MKVVQYEAAVNPRPISGIIERCIPSGKKNAISLVELTNRCGCSHEAIKHEIDNLIKCGVPIMETKSMLGTIKYYKSTTAEYEKMLQKASRKQSNIEYR